MQERSFKDNNGTSRVMMTHDDAPLGGNFGEDSYVLANRPSTGKKMKTPEAITKNIGIGSPGFAGVASLATIIAVAGAIIAYLTLRY